MNLDAATICIRCGLPASEVDLAGCTRDTDVAHDYRDLADRPFAEWAITDIVARMERASMKGASASSTAEHFATCPTAGAGTYVHRLYVQKAQKRLGLARALADELWHRSGAKGISPLETAVDVLAMYHRGRELDADECEAVGLDPTGRNGDPRWPFHLGDLTPAQRERLDNHNASRRPWKLR